MTVRAMLQNSLVWMWLVQIMGKKCQNPAAVHARQAQWLAPHSRDDLEDSSTHVNAPIVDSSSECGVDVDSGDSDDDYDEGERMGTE